MVKDFILLPQEMVELGTNSTEQSLDRLFDAIWKTVEPK